MSKGTLTLDELNKSLIAAVDRATLKEVELTLFERQYAELLLMKQKIEDPTTHPVIVAHLPDVLSAIEVWEKRISPKDRKKVQKALKEKFSLDF